MPGAKKPPEYFEARRAINQHLFRHHNGALGEGMLAQRLDMHEKLHDFCRERGIEAGHDHSEMWLEGEKDTDVARRMLAEGVAQHGAEERGPSLPIERRVRRGQTNTPKH